MARIKKGVNGPLSGKVGTVICSNWRGIEYMRHKGRKITKKPSVAQLTQRARFGLMSKFLYSMRALVNRSFEIPGIKSTGLNNALSYNMKNAVAGDYPGFSINYGMVLLSKGDLPNVAEAAAAATGNGQIQWGWINNAGTGMANADDKTIVIVHCPDHLGQTLFAVGGTTRGDEDAGLDTRAFTGKAVETWLGFMSADEKEIATSIYTGSVMVE